MTFFWVLALGLHRSAAQDMYISPSGSDANDGLTQATAKRSLQSAVLNVSAGGTIQVLPGTYDGGFSIQRQQRTGSFKIQGALNPGDPKPTITLRNVNSLQNQHLFYLDNIPDVTIRGLRLEVNKTRCLDGIFAIGNIHNLVLNDLDVVAMASDSDNVSGGVGLYYQGISIDGGPATTPPSVTVSNVSISATVTGFQGSTFFFNRGILLRSVAGTVGGPSVASTCTIQAERDILTQFINGAVTIQNNQFSGGGVDITLPNATGDVRLLGNTFTVDRRINFLLQETVLLKHNANGTPILFEGNTITGHTNVALRSAGVRNAIIRNNTFIPNDSAQNYRHIEVNTLWEGSTQTPVVANSVEIVGNQFREAAVATGGIAINLKNERKGAALPNPDFSQVKIGGAGTDANVFDQRIRKYVVLDARTGRNFNLDLDLSENQFKITGTPQLPAAMTQVSLLDLEDKFDHYIDADSAGLIRVKTNELYVTPRSFLRPQTTSASIQRAITRSQATDVVNIRDTLYQNPVTLDKPLIFSMPGPLTSIESLGMQLPAAADRLTITNKLTVRGQVALQTGKVKLGRNDLVLETPGAANPSTPSVQSYILTDSAGHLVYNGLAATALSYPIGTDTAYRPVVMANAGTADNVGLRIQPDVLSQATAGTPVDTVVRFTWFANEATAGGGSYSFTPLWFQADEKPEFNRENAFVQKFEGGRWLAFEQAPRPAQGTNPYTITQDTIRDGLIELPLRVYAPEDLRDTIFYVDGVDGQDNFPLISGRSPERAWKTLQYAVSTAYRVTPSRIIHIRLKSGIQYTEAVSIPERQSKMSIRGGYTGSDTEVDLILPDGVTDLLTANADTLLLDRIHFVIQATSPGGRGIILDSSCRYAVFDSLRINSSQNTASGSGIVSLLDGPAGTRRLFLTSTGIQSSTPGATGFATGISGSSLSGIIGGNRPLVNNGITAPAALDLQLLTGDSLLVARNTMFGNVVMKGSTGNLRFKRNIIQGRVNLEGFAGAASVARIDSNDVSEFAGTGLYIANNRTSLIANNVFTPAAAAGNTATLHLNSEYSAPIPTGVQYVTQTVAITGNNFVQNDVAQGTAILLSNGGAGQVNPAFNPITIGGPTTTVNTFNESHVKYIRLNPVAGLEFPFAVDARQNLYGISATLKTPAAMSQAELFSLENKVDHTVDYSPLGFVRMRDQKTYVTQTSFLSGFTTRPAIQRAVVPAAEGDEVNIEDFNYADTVTIGKSLIFNSSGDATQSGRLVMDGVGKELTLLKDYTLAGSLNLTNGRVRITDNDVILTETAAAIEGGNPGSYVITPSTGTLLQRGIGTGAKADSMPFAIGTEASYLPLSIRNTGTADDFSLRVFPEVRSNGLSGNLEDSVVNATWVLNEATAGGSVLTITPQWNESDERFDFDRNRCIVQGYFGGKWDFFASRALKRAQGSNPYFITEPAVAGQQFNQMPLRVYSYLPPNILFIPKLFSPNNDARNDDFKLYSQTLIGGRINFKIYNRYGNLLYESSNPEQLLNEGWNGMVNGKKANTGTYVWQLSGTFSDGRKLEVEGKTVGEFTLIR